MKRMLIILLLLAGPALADHHRGHAVMHLDNSLRFLDAALAIADSNNLTKYQIYAGKYRDRIEAARVLLTTGGDLEEVRRLVSAPGFGSELESADYGVAATVSILAVAVRDGADSYQMSSILTRHSKADQFLGWAHWHVIDAIREDIYEDQAFICAGPGNHCDGD